MKIYDSAEIRKWDAFTIENEPIRSLELMERAATLCTRQIIGSALFESVDIFCGIGNNGGDGLVIARLLYERGKKVRVIILEFSQNFAPDFKANLEKLPKGVEKIVRNEANSGIKIEGDLIIDAIFGSGLSKPIGGWIGMVTDQVNNSGKRIISVDMPSGLFATDNRDNDLSHVVKASDTISFQCPKMAFFYPAYHPCVGDFKVIDIGLFPEFEGESIGELAIRENVHLKERDEFSHKGSHGYLTVIAGRGDMLGAAILCSKAAFRTGCGYVGVNSSEKGVSALLGQLPEAIWHGNETISPKSTAIAVGPGLGLNIESKSLLEQTLTSGLPAVFDADALTILAENSDLMDLLPENSILTPHPGELERLIGKTKSDEETLEMQVEFSKKHKVFIIQKGAYSKLTCPDGRIFVNSSGNPAMATAGMGDALTGIIGSLLAQGYSPEEAAKYGMFIHGFAGDLYVRDKGERGMLTSDLIDTISEALNLL